MNSPVKAAATAAVLLITAPAVATAGERSPWCAPGQPTCSPGLADSSWPLGHANPWATDASPVPGPRSADRTVVQPLRNGIVTVGALFSARYGDGGRAVWAGGGTLDRRGYAFKFDLATGREIGRVSTDLPGNPASPLSGAYGMLDDRGHMLIPRGREILVVGDARRGERLSPPKLLWRTRLPARAFCRAGDEVVGITALSDGRPVVTTRLGTIVVLPRGAGPTAGERALITRINGSRCRDRSVAESALEQISNSLAAGDQRDLYPVTNRAQYRFDADRTRIRRVWRGTYRTGAAEGGVRLDAGSGSTPSLMGTRRRGDRFVVITDGSRVMNLVLMWRGRIPRDWKGLPGRPRRIACEYPVRFGRTNPASTKSEQSVVVHGYGAYLPDNEIRGGTTPGGDRYDRLLEAALAGGDPARAPYGVERIDWDPERQRCRTRWANRQVSLPNGVPFVSSGSRMLYGIGQRDGLWGLEGLDLTSGRSRLWVPASREAFDNSLYSQLSIAPDGSLWTGSLGGLMAYRPRP